MTSVNSKTELCRWVMLKTLCDYTWTDEDKWTDLKKNNDKFRSNIMLYLTKANILYRAVYLCLQVKSGWAEAISLTVALCKVIKMWHLDIFVCLATILCKSVAWESNRAILPVKPSCYTEREWEEEVRDTWQIRFFFWAVAVSCQLYSFMSTKLTFDRRNNSMNCEWLIMIACFPGLIHG